MNKRNIAFFSILLCTALATKAQTLTVSSVATLADGEVEIAIEASNEVSNYIATGFLLELPDGCEVSSIEGRKANNMNSDHVVRVGQVNDNKIRVAVYSLSNSSFDISKADGSTSPLNICIIKLSISNVAGNYKGKLYNIEFATSNHNLVTANPSTFDFTSQTLGDVNNDGTVDISDYIGVANHILGNTPVGFNESAADVNNDGSIDISDYIGVANIILTGKP